MPVKPAKQMASELSQFLVNARKSVKQIEELQRRLENESDFQKLWESDSAKALQEVGIDPNARMEVGKEPYERGPECVYCITPMGNACHC
jgi:hypothetical protein